MIYCCPFCEMDPAGYRERDDQGNAWHMEPNGIIHMPCYERNRATPAEIAEDQENAYREAQYRETAL